MALTFLTQVLRVEIVFKIPSSWDLQFASDRLVVPLIVTSRITREMAPSGDLGGSVEWIVAPRAATSRWPCFGDGYRYCGPTRGVPLERVP